MYGILKTVATICVLATICTVGHCDRKTNRVVRQSNRSAQYSQQSTRSGWLPSAREWEVKRGVGTGSDKEGGSSDTSTINKSLRPVDTFCPSGYTEKRNNQGTPSDETSEATEVKLPDIIKKDGNENKNFVLMLSTKWCNWCKPAAVIMEEATKGEYITYKFELDDPKYKYLEKELKITAYPTFIIFKDGKEVDRATGVRLRVWFTKRLTKKIDQPDIPKPKPKPEPTPSNIYDGL